MRKKTGLKVAVEKTFGKRNGSYESPKNGTAKGFDTQKERRSPGVEMEHIHKQLFGKVNTSLWGEREIFCKQ